MTPVYFPQDVAGVLKSSQIKWDEFWPELHAAQEAGVDKEISFNEINFGYKAKRDKFHVEVSFGNFEDIWLSKSDFLQEVPKWVKGAPRDVR